MFRLFNIPFFDSLVNINSNIDDYKQVHITGSEYWNTNTVGTTFIPLS